MAVGGGIGMMSVPALALELGDLNINSSLGQPLRASIAYALNPHEELYDFCVYLRPGLAANGLPALSRASVSIADGMILLAGSRAIREPLLTMQVSIDCPYTAHISREYTLMINPPTPVVEVSSLIETSATPVAQAPTAGAPEPRAPVEARGNTDRSPIVESSRYLVQRGDSLSDIASRISNRSIPLWPAVDRIFAVNPDAFMDGDINRLKAGSWLDIPDLSAAAETSPVSETVAAADTAPIASVTEEFTAYTGYEAPAAAVSEALVVAADVASAPTVVDTNESEGPVVSEPATGDSDFSNSQPGDVAVGKGSPFVSPIGAAGGTESTVIPDTEIAQPALQPVPVVSTDTDTAGKTSGSWSWFIWLGGTGLALILGLLLFGQKFRQRFGSVAVGAVAEPLPGRRKTDDNVQSTDAVIDVDFQVPEASPHSSSMMLDADFDDGSGLQDAADMDVAQDFGFSASASFDEELDMVLPESADEEVSSGLTDIIGPLQRDDELLVLDSEVMPDDEDDGDYNLSMIVDATKQDIGESDATEKDLQAVQVDSEADSEPNDATVDREVDYRILEQDYQDEFTATQALNAEIEKAAAKLANRMDIDATGEMTAKLPENTQAVNDDISESGVNAEVTAELQGADNDIAVEMPIDDNDVTADMLVESGVIDTKKKKKAS